MAELKSHFIKESFPNYYTFLVFPFSGNIYSVPPLSIWSQVLLFIFKLHCESPAVRCFIK